VIVPTPKGKPRKSTPTYFAGPRPAPWKPFNLPASHLSLTAPETKFDGLPRNAGPWDDLDFNPAQLLFRPLGRFYKLPFHPCRPCLGFLCRPKAIPALRNCGGGRNGMTLGAGCLRCQAPWGHPPENRQNVPPAKNPQGGAPMGNLPLADSGNLARRPNAPLGAFFQRK